MKSEISRTACPGQGGPGGADFGPSRSVGPLRVLVGVMRSVAAVLSVVTLVDDQRDLAMCNDL